MAALISSIVLSLATTELVSELEETAPQRDWYIDVDK